MSQQPTQATTGHAVCVRCFPDLTGPAICGAPVNAAPVVGVCEVCHALAFTPCPGCQGEKWDIWARIMTADDAEIVAAHLAGLADCDNEHTRDCG